MKRIALCAPYLVYGGAEVQFNKLVRVLSAQDGVKLSVFALSSDERSLKQASVLRSEGVKVYLFGFNPSVDGKVLAAWALLRLFISVALFRPSVLYFYTLYLFPLSFFAMTPVRVIFSERILSPSVKKRWVIYKFISLFVREIVVNGESLLQYFKQTKMFRTVYLVPNWVDGVSFSSCGNKGVAVVARLSREKNIHSLLSAIRGEGVVINLYYSAVDPDYEKFLRNISSRSGSVVNFCGEKSLKEIYTENSILVHPSLSEGCPNVVVEAMLSGFPCLVSDIEEHLYLNLHPKSIYSLADTSSLLEQLRWWGECKHSDLEKVLAKNKMAAKSFSYKNFSERVRELFLG